jgi:hypothetical protein
VIEVGSDAAGNQDNGGPHMRHAQSIITMQSNAAAILPMTKYLFYSTTCTIQSFASPPTSTILDLHRLIYLPCPRARPSTFFESQQFPLTNQPTIEGYNHTHWPGTGVYRIHGSHHDSTIRSSFIMSMNPCHRPITPQHTARLLTHRDCSVRFDTSKSRNTDRKWLERST